MRRLLALPLLLGAAIAHAQEPLTLERAISLALTNNERAAIATEEVRAAEARVARARAFFFPDVTVNNIYTRRLYEDSGSSNQNNNNGLVGTINLGQTLFDARSFPLLRFARLTRDSIVHGARDDRRLLAFDTAAAFLITLTQQRISEAADRRRQFATESLRDARARFEAGLVSSNDVTRADLELASAELARTTARVAFQTSAVELANLIGVPQIEGPLAEPAPLIETAATAPTTPAAVSEAIDRRPDVASLRTNAAALREFAKEPALRFVPSLTMNGQFRHDDDVGTDARENDGFIALNLSWAAFDGGERFADRAERLAIVRQAELNLQALERRVDLEMRSANAELEGQRASMQQAAAAANAARKNANETAELYRQGLARALEVADANLRLFEADSAESRARYALALAFLSWRAAIGVGPMGEEVR